MAGPSKVRPTPDGNWIAQGGKSRNFVNAETGEVISRRQFDKRYGALAKGGFSSYEAKAKAHQPLERAARPARGRGSSRQPTASVQPLPGRLSRSIRIPFDVVRTDDTDEFAIQAESAREPYLNAVAGALRNNKILALRIVIQGHRNGVSFAKTVVPLTTPQSMPSWALLLDALFEATYDADELEELDIGIRFKSEFVPMVEKPRTLRRKRPSRRKRK